MGTFEKVVLVVFLSILTLLACVMIWTAVDPVFENRRTIANLQTAIVNLQTSGNNAMAGLSARIIALESKKRR